VHIIIYSASFGSFLCLHHNNSKMCLLITCISLSGWFECKLDKSCLSSTWLFCIDVFYLSLCGILVLNAGTLRSFGTAIYSHLGSNLIQRTLYLPTYQNKVAKISEEHLQGRLSWNFQRDFRVKWTLRFDLEEGDRG